MRFEAPPALSSAHLAVQSAPADLRPALAALMSVLHAVRSIERQVSDPAVAAAKLGWWVGELAQAQPAHPALQALAQYAVQPPRAALLRLVQAEERWLNQGRLLDEAALLGHAADIGGPLGNAAAAVLQADAATTALASAAAAMRLSEIVCGLGADLRRGRLFIPIDDLQRAGLKAHELTRMTEPWPYDERFRQLMARQADRARGALAASAEELGRVARTDAALRRRLRPARVLLALAQLGLDEAARQRFELLHQRVKPGPLPRWWAAASTR